MRRTLEDVERSARIEAERSRMAFDIQQQSEVRIQIILYYKIIIF
jgi:hypothetical protein